MAKANDALPLSAIQQIDAACDHFEADWKAGKKPAIEKFLGKTTGQERAELLRALLRLELELQSNSDQKSQSSYEARFPEEASVVGSVFKEFQDRGTLPPRTPTADTSVSQESLRSNASAHATKKGTGSKDMPKKIGRFEILEMVGQGGCGMVFKARDPDLDRLVAIKVPLQGALETPEEIARFLREARAAATLHHPNLCPVHDVGQEEGHYYIVMAFVEGKSLSAHLKERTEPLPARQAALILRKLALALTVAHAKGIIHRDLKPANIMIDGERKDVVIMDFGLARQRKNGEALQTKEGVVMGTPTYMAPEQARGDVKAIGPTSDVYSLGVILYEMLAGKPPFTGSVMEVICQVMADEPQPPSSRREAVDPNLEAICLKAMAKVPAQRYPNMKALADDLDRFLKGLSEKTAPAAKTVTKSPETAGLSDLAKTLSAERKKETKEAIEEAVRRAHIPLWKWLAGAGLLAVLIVGGVIFFARTPSATVIINVNVDLSDKTLAFFLDGKSISAEKLKVPIELTVGKHELIAKRGETIVHRFTFTVSRDAGPRIEVGEDQIVPPKKSADDFGPLVFEHSLAAADTLDKVRYSVGWGSKVVVVPGTGLRLERGNTNSVVWPRLFLGDRYRVAFDVRVKKDGWAGWILNGPGYGNSVHTGYRCQLTETSFSLFRADKEVQTRPLPKSIVPSDWVAVRADINGGKITVTLNDAAVAQFTDAEPLTGPLHGWFGLAGAGPVYRNLRIWSAAKDTDRKRQLTPPLTEKPLVNGKLLHELKLAGEKLGAEWWRSPPNGVTKADGALLLAGADAILTRPLPADLACEVEFEYPTPEEYGLSIRLWFAKKAPESTKDCDAGWLITVPMTDGRSTVSWHDGPKHVHEFGGFFSAAPMLVSTPNYGPIAGRKYVARMETFGDQLRLFLDGGLVMSARRPPGATTPATPVFFGLNQHFSTTKIHALRIYQITPPETSGFVPLFNGKDLTGWHVESGNPKQFSVEDGAIVARSPNLGNRNYLLSNKDYMDFTLRLEFMRDQASGGGVVVRGLEGEKIVGEVIDHPILKLTSSSGTTHLLKDDKQYTRPSEDLKLPTDVWHTLEITVRGDTLTAILAGKKIVDIRLDPDYKGDFVPGLKRMKGKIGFQAHSGTMRYRRVEIKELSAPSGETDPVASPTAAERQAIAAVFKLGGRVTVIKGGRGHDAGRPGELPPEPYYLFGVDWIQRPVQNGDLAVLTGLPRLGDLWLGGSKVSDAGLAHLANLPKLGGLRLESTAVTGAGFRSLDKAENLGCLYLQGSKVNDAGVEALGRRPKLLELYMSATPITDEALKSIASNFPGLAQLGVQGTKITNAGLAHLKGHAGLVNLFLDNTAITNEGLAHLSGLGIQRLELIGTGITDEGLVHLEKMRRLTFLTLAGTKVTPAGIDRLQKALPKCEVISK